MDKATEFRTIKHEGIREFSSFS